MQTLDPMQEEHALEKWAEELGCTIGDLVSALGESGRLHFELAPTEQYELDLAAEIR
jgi:hypothetical protein